MVSILIGWDFGASCGSGATGDGSIGSSLTPFGKDSEGVSCLLKMDGTG